MGGDVVVVIVSTVCREHASEGGQLAFSKYVLSSGCSSEEEVVHRRGVLSA